MEPKYWPTFGTVLKYLERLGFKFDRSREGYVIPYHPTEGSWFGFRDIEPALPAREADLLDMKVQLTYRGFVTDDEFADFWDQGRKRIPEPVQPTAPSA
jgi:hypothetical protein